MRTDLFTFTILFCDILVLFVPYRSGMGSGREGGFIVTQGLVCDTVLFSLGVFYIPDSFFSIHQHLNILSLFFACKVLLS